MSPFRTDVCRGGWVGGWVGGVGVGVWCGGSQSIDAGEGWGQIVAVGGWRGSGGFGMK